MEVKKMDIAIMNSHAATLDHPELFMFHAKYINYLLQLGKP